MKKITEYKERIEKLKVEVQEYDRYASEVVIINKKLENTVKSLTRKLKLKAQDINSSEESSKEEIDFQAIISKHSPSAATTSYHQLPENCSSYLMLSLATRDLQQPPPATSHTHQHSKTFIIHHRQSPAITVHHQPLKKTTSYHGPLG